MIITKIEESEKNRKKIYIDGGYAFFLYPKELLKYSIKEGEELGEELLLEIRQKVVLVRAKRKMLALLSRKDYTCEEIARKLRQGYYSEDIIEEAVSYGVCMRYLDDERYAREYIAWKKESKSLRQIGQELSQKGIAKSIYEPILDAEEDDEEILKTLISRYMKKQSGEEIKKRQKTYRYFMQKGYSGALIHQILSQL